MSIGKPKKMRISLEKEKKNEPSVNDIARLYKDKKHKVKQELSFKTKNNKSKLA